LFHFHTYTFRQINTYTPIAGRKRRRGNGFRVPRCPPFRFPTPRAAGLFCS
jgi:hypothetical protein